MTQCIASRTTRCTARQRITWCSASQCTA
jgi:hypothetical protein